MKRWLQDLWDGFFTVLVGMRITWRHLFTQPVTLQYPTVKWPLPPKSRMRLFMKYEDCIGCGQCVRACPVNCISIKAEKRPADAPPIWAANGQPIKLHVAVFDIDMSLCCYCNLCTYPCPTNCIYMTPEYEFATSDLTQHLYRFAKKDAQFILEDPKKKAAAGRARADGSARGSSRDPAGDARPEPDAMNAEAFVFWVFAIVTVASAAVVVLSRQLIYSAFALLFTFFGVAGLYVLLGADFLAATQLLVYVGGILVLLLFGVMLTHKIYDLDLRTETTQFAPGVIVAVGLFVILASTAVRTQWMGARAAPGPDHGGDRPALPGPVPPALRGGLRPPPGRPHRRGHDRPAPEGRMIGLQHYLVVSAALFSLGVLGLLTRRNAVHVLMSIELILNSANLNLVAFSRFAAGNLGGQIFGVFVIVVAAAEVAVALAIVLTLYRLRRTPNLDEADILKG